MSINKHVWVLKHGQGERGRTWRRLATTQRLTVAQTIDLGEEQNSPTMVANQGLWCMLWHRDNLAELAALSIYSV